MASPRRILVVGAGRSGRAAAALAHARGVRVTLWDEQSTPPPDPRWEAKHGPLTWHGVQAVDRVVVSPGVDVSTRPVLEAAARAGLPIQGEIGWAAEHLAIPTIAVTGTNGKSTVTTFVGELLRAAMPGRTFVGGNLGEPLSEAARDGGYDRAVVEVSSYQLERAVPFRPAVSAILNLTPDHLARHGSMEEYARVKWRVMHGARDTDLCLVPRDHALLAATDPGGGLRAGIGSLPGVCREGSTVRVAFGSDEVVLDLTDVRVRGAHNLDHAATAAALCLASGADPGAIQRALVGLHGLPHRMEKVHEASGVSWVNDSKATNVDASRVAIAGLHGRAVVLLGGQLKGDPAEFEALADGLRRHRAVLCFGGAGEAIRAVLAKAGVGGVEALPGLREAVSQARRLVREGDTVLLSPGCASFDAFEDFEHRGRAFSALAREEGCP